VQDVGGAQRRDRRRHQIAPDGVDGRAAGEQDVGGILALVDHPPITGKAGARDIGQQRIDQPRLTLEERRPIGVGEPLAQGRHRLEVLDVGDLVVGSLVVDPDRIHLSRQPLAAVDVDLDLVGVCRRTCIQPNSGSIRYR
jgi:hypothetical protein